MLARLEGQRAEHLVGPGRVLHEQDREVAAAEPHGLGAAERGGDLLQARRRRRPAAQPSASAERRRRERVVDVVEPGQRQVDVRDARRACAARSGRCACRCSVMWCAVTCGLRAPRVAVGAVVVAEVAHEDRVVDVRGAAAAAVLGVGGVLHLRHRHALRPRRRSTAADPVALARSARPTRVVGVEHELLDRRRRQRLGPALGDRLELAVAVELVAEQVAQQQRARADLGEDLRQPELVDLEQPGVAAARRSSAVATPPAMLAPARLCTSVWPPRSRIRAAIAAVVVLPFVAERIALVSGRESRSIASRLHPQQQLAGQRRATAAGQARGRPGGPGCQLARPHAGSSTLHRVGDRAHGARQLADRVAVGVDREGAVGADAHLGCRAGRGPRGPRRARP